MSRTLAAAAACAVALAAGSCATNPESGTHHVVFTSVSTGESHTCGVTTRHAAYCWGWQLNGQLGNNTPGSDYQTIPAPVFGGLAFATVSAGLCAVAGWLIGRRYGLPLRSQLAWALFHLVAGFPGFLAFLSVREWPARELCPNCGRVRTVDRAHCQHCGSGFAPPERKGSEIFEMAGTV